MKVYLDDKGQPILPQYGNLTERLAQAERMAAANLRNYNKLLEAAERERDEWKAKYEGHGVWAAMSPDTMERVLKERTTERDAALAKADELTRKHQHSEARRMAAVGRADAAESELADRIKSAQHYGHEAALAHGQLADLRARIEALADEWGDAGWAHARALRALLQPAEPETALDVLSRIEDIVARSGMGENSYTEPLAKLRKLLEEQK